MPNFRNIIRLVKEGNLFYEKKRRDKQKRINSLNLSTKDYLSRTFENTFGKKPDIENPQTFNEKLLWLKLYWRNDLVYDCCDKYLVREYVKNRGCEYLLNDLFFVFDKVEDIDFKALPSSFVMKTTHDSGGVFICKDKNDKKKYQEGIDRIKHSFGRTYSNTLREWSYDKIVPKIIIEKLIETHDGHSPKDYKFFCFDGEPKLLFVGSERDKEIKFDFFDLNWNHLNVRNVHRHSKNKIEKPKKLLEMIEICRKLSKGFPFVRVDLYYENDQIIFGELTFFHNGGNERFTPSSFDKYLGNFLVLPNRNHEE